jgi:hypothetical protein
MSISLGAGVRTGSRGVYLDMAGNEKKERRRRGAEGSSARRRL